MSKAVTPDQDSVGASIGLRRNSVKLLPHQVVWQDVFQTTKTHLQEILGDRIVDIQHVGSTAVANLSAKPIIDVLVGMENLKQIQHIMPILTAHDYEYRGERSATDDHLFVKGPQADIRTHHIHIVTHQGTLWQDYVYFRDALRADLVLAQRYAQLKEELAEQYRNDRGLYTAGKTVFIQEILTGR
ncbi:MAG: GrpB family protein [Bacteroidota bacterium]